MLANSDFRTHVRIDGRKYPSSHSEVSFALPSVTGRGLRTGTAAGDGGGELPLLHRPSSGTRGAARDHGEADFRSSMSRLSALERRVTREIRDFSAGLQVNKGPLP